MSELWPPIIADAKASLGDLRALSRYDFNAERFGELRVGMLQIGTASPATSTSPMRSPLSSLTPASRSCRGRRTKE